MGRRRLKSSRLACIALFVGLGALGCAGGRYDVEAAHAKVPVSFSPALVDHEGKVVRLGTELEAVGTVEEDFLQVGMLYGAVGGTLDISDAINEAVAKHRGDGVVNLRVTNKSSCALNFFFPLTILPFWPGCTYAIVQGVVVRHGKSRPAAASTEGRR